METHFKEIERQHSALARERVFADLRTLARDAEDLLKATAHDAGEKTREVRDRLATALGRAKGTCNGLPGNAAARAKETAQRAGTVLRAHPYEALAAAFGLGVIVGLLLRRR